MSTDQNTVTDYANQTVQSLGEKLYLDDNTADVYFAVKIGNNDDAIERIPAHKCQLAAASNVFKAMFFGDIKELGDVKLTDIHVSAFKEFLQFFYLSRVQLTMENFGEVMNFGQKYNVSECLSVGHRFLRYNLTVDDVCSAYDTALVLDLKEMKEMCEKVISINTEDVFQSDGFLNCTVGTLLKILKLDLLSCYETDVFKACVSWVKATSQQNEVTKELMQIHLGELFYEIRFRLMSFAQFSELIASFGHLFSADELREVIQMIPSKDFEPKLFNNKLRGVEWNETKIIEYVKDLKGGFGNRYLHEEHSVIFSTNEQIIFGEFICQCVRVYRNENYHDLTNDLPTEITISEKSDASDLSRVIAKMKSAFQPKRKTVFTLPAPVLIRPGFKYKIRFEQSAEGHCFKIKVMETVVEMDSDIILSFHDCYLQPGTNQAVNVFSGLKFNKI